MPRLYFPEPDFEADNFAIWRHRAVAFFGTIYTMLPSGQLTSTRLTAHSQYEDKFLTFDCDMATVYDGMFPYIIDAEDAFSEILASADAAAWLLLVKAWKRFITAQHRSSSHEQVVLDVEDRQKRYQLTVLPATDTPFCIIA